MLTLYRRHRRHCDHRAEGREYRRCRCPIWVDGFLGGQDIRKSLKVRDWEEAQRLVRDWEIKNEQTSDAVPSLLTIHDAWQQFLNDAKARGLREPTLRKYKHLAQKMEQFGHDLGLRYVKEFDLEVLRKFRASWPNQNLSALKKLELMRTFFRFASESGWVPDNPAKKIRNPRVSDRPTMPFTPEEMVAILLALNKYGNSELRGVRRLAALVLLLRYSGLRISDAVTLACSRIVHDKLFLYTSKAGTPVYCPLPRSVVQALSEIPKPGERYFFWTGNSKPKTIITHWQECLQRLFELARIERGHAHRFRDTFAVELLLHGVPIERVSVLLGHKSIRVTEKHYAPWVRARQEQLEADVRRTWKTDSVLRRRTKGTPKVHAGVHCAN